MIQKLNDNDIPPTHIRQLSGHRNVQSIPNYSGLNLNLQSGGDRGAGARENRGREGYGRRERKGREAGVLRGREAGEQCKTVNFLTY